MRAIITFMFVMMGAHLCCQESIDLPIAATARVDNAVGAGNSFTVDLIGWRDIFSVGYVANEVKAGDLFIDSKAEIYQVTSVTASPSINRVTIVLEDLSPPFQIPTGAGVVWEPLPGGLIPEMPDDNNGISKFLKSAIANHNFRIQSKGTPGNENEVSQYRRDTLVISNLEVIISVAGASPTISGSAGNYRITIAEDSEWQWMNASTEDAQSVTDANDFALEILNENGTQDRSIAAIYTSDDTALYSPEDYGIGVNQTAGAPGSFFNLFFDIGALGGFTIYLSK